MNAMTLTPVHVAEPLRDQGQTENECGRPAPAARRLLVEAAQGDRVAQRDLGLLYLDGLGVPADEAWALRWLLRAGAQGDRQAQFQSGQLYASLARTPEDLVEAYKWYSLAAEQGVSVGPEPFEALELWMTDEEVHKALELASDCRPCPE